MSVTTSNIANVLDFVVHEANGLKGLVDSGLQTLPDQYIQPPEERFTATHSVHEHSIPIIDVANWNDPKVAESIYEAARKWGFFQIINHGIPLDVLDSIKNAAHGFFQLSNEERKKYWKGRSVSDTVSYATSFSPLAEKVLEWKDFVSFKYVPGDLEGSALWPSVCKDQVLDYMKRLEPVIRKLLELLLKKLNVQEMDKAKEYALMGSLLLNMNYYPQCPNPDLTAGVLPHSDISSITVLLQDDIGGLYVRGLERNGWIYIPPVHGALVINVGDVLQIMSNDVYKSVEHRVVASGSRNRVSVPVFVNPAFDAVIGPLTEAVENGETPLYKQVVFSDYFKYFFSKAHDGKDTLNFART